MARNLFAKLSLEDENSTTTPTEVTAVDVVDAVAATDEVNEVNEAVGEYAAANDEANELVGVADDAIAQADTVLANPDASETEIAATAAVANEALKLISRNTGFTRSNFVSTEDITNSPRRALELAREELVLAREGIINAIANAAKKAVRRVSDGVTKFVNLFVSLDKQVTELISQVEARPEKSFTLDDYARESIARIIYIARKTSGFKNSFDLALKGYSVQVETAKFIAKEIENFGINAFKNIKDDPAGVMTKFNQTLGSTVYGRLFKSAVDTEITPELEKAAGNKKIIKAALLDPIYRVYLIETDMNGYYIINADSRHTQDIAKLADTFKEISKTELLSVLKDTHAKVKDSFGYGKILDKDLDFKALDQTAELLISLAVSKGVMSEFTQLVGVLCDVYSYTAYGSYSLLQKAVKGALTAAREAVKSKPADTNM